MKVSLLSLGALLLCSTGLQAQVADSASTGTGYKDQVFYNIETGAQTASPNANWDIAFQIKGISSSIMINDGLGAELRSVPGSNEDSWDKPLDTTGMESWPMWNNSTASWDGGAFNMGSDYNTGDFGWGEYNMSSHIVSGKTLFVAMLPDGSYKKIFIDALAGGVYNFRYANIDGSGEVQASLDKKNYAGKNFGYYSLSANQAVDREPVADAWDLTFGKYVEMLQAGPGDPIPYPVTGVRINAGVTAAKVTDVPVNESVAPDESAFTESIATIGYDWKTFKMATNTYEISATTSFFVKAQSGNLYKLIFTGFTGSGTGRFIFAKTQLNTSSVGEEGSAGVMAMYPTVGTAGEPLSLVFSFEQPTAGEVTVCDITGRKVFARELPSTGENMFSLDVPALGSGMYFVAVRIGGSVSVQRLLIQ